MRRISHSIKISVIMFAMLTSTACQEFLNEPAENQMSPEGVDYTITANTILPLIGYYAQFQNFAWENYPLIATMGDDVNAGGMGDQGGGYTDIDMYSKYVENTYWMFNSVWCNLYRGIYTAHSTMEQIALYREHATDKTNANQYIAEAKVIRAWELFLLSRMWGKVFIPRSSDQSEIYSLPLSTKDEVMKHISDQMDAALPYLPAVNPNKRTDIRGGVTKYTALAIKALANLELKNYQAVADATSQIISSNEFALKPDFYELFKINGKLNNENLFEMQYSDLENGSGVHYDYLFSFFGPLEWTPKVAGAKDGWGFFEPSMKYIKFMLDRGETVRLETSVIFTNRGISEIKKDPEYATLPDWISNTTRSGDIFNDFAREMFCSGKHYLPSDQLNPGRTAYGTNKNFTCIRYAEILLMHAEALTQGASSSVMNADAAVNAVRVRAGLTPLSGVTNAQVMDEKFAELAMEWGTRFYDMVRLGKYDELSYDGRTFTGDKIYYPYPQTQVNLLPILKQ
jgi:hypothetical protein